MVCTLSEAGRTMRGAQLKELRNKKKKTQKKTSSSSASRTSARHKKSLTTSHSEATQPVLRRSSRIRKKPQRL